MTSPKWKNPAAFEDVCEALESMHDAFSPFTLRPVGAPGSDMRLQEAQRIAHTAARIALRRARGETEGG